MIHKHARLRRGKLFLCAFLGVLLLTGMRNTFTEHRLVSIGLAYAVSIGWTGLFAMAVYTIVGLFWRGGKAWLGAATIFLIMILYVDPYASGRIGGDANAHPEHNWQVLATGLTVLLLLSGGALAFSGRRKLASLIYIADLAAFTSVNVVLILRDGSTRFYAGYDWTPTPLVIMVAGLIVRAAIVYGVSFRRMVLEHPKAASTG